MTLTFAKEMKPLRRMSSVEAAAEATRLAADFLSSADSKGWTGNLGDAKPDPIESQKEGKIHRYWISLVHWTKDGSELDGPAVIRVDLVEKNCVWE